MERRDWQFDIWIRLLYESRFADNATHELKTTDERFVSVVKTFAENTRQVYRMGHFLIGVFHAGKMTQLAECHALQGLTGTFVRPEHLPIEKANEMYAARERIILRGAMPDGSQVPYSACPTSGDEVFQNADVWNIDQFAQLLMSMQIVAAWTVFETLFSDLWEAAINCHPIGLSELKGTRTKPTRKDGNQEREKDTALSEKS